MGSGLGPGHQTVGCGCGLGAGVGWVLGAGLPPGDFSSAAKHRAGSCSEGPWQSPAPQPPSPAAACPCGAKCGPGLATYLQAHGSWQGKLARTLPLVGPCDFHLLLRL